MSRRAGKAWRACTSAAGGPRAPRAMKERLRRCANDTGSEGTFRGSARAALAAPTAIACGGIALAAAAPTGTPIITGTIPNPTTPRASPTGPAITSRSTTIPTARSSRPQVQDLHQRRGAGAGKPPHIVPAVSRATSTLQFAGEEVRRRRLQVQDRARHDHRPGGRLQVGVRLRGRGRRRQTHQRPGDEGLVLVHRSRRRRHRRAHRHLHRLRLHPRALRLARAPLQEDDLQAGLGAVPELGLHVAHGHRSHPLLGRHLLHVAVPRDASAAADHRHLPGHPRDHPGSSVSRRRSTRLPSGPASRRCHSTMAPTSPRSSAPASRRCPRARTKPPGRSA